MPQSRESTNREYSVLFVCKGGKQCGDDNGWFLRIDIQHVLYSLGARTNMDWRGVEGGHSESRGMMSDAAVEDHKIRSSCNGFLGVRAEADRGRVT